ncbi:MAG: hypothetical protein HZA04_08725, partial [Nitrospinae bacterium]|nr:hypothetical protein [Nitrospinota bacterium]
EDSSPEGGFDLITFVPGDQKEWHRQDFIKISAGSSSKDFGNYGPNIFTKYGYNIPYETIPKKESIPAVKAGNATSGNAGGSPSPVRRQPAATHSSGGGGTLERRGDQVYRIEEDGKNRGSFYSP